MASGHRIPYAGVLLVVLGGLFLADQLGALHIGPLFHTWWPLVLVIAGGLNLLERPTAPLAPLVLVTIGVALLLSNLHVVAFGSVWKLWPLILVALGLNMLLSHRAKG